ncbi:glucan biosynthesis protein [Salinicola rhizosphaerae]|uniref:Glucans biosynthesis protein D n=1 Tax=Salinicola rhizosphaerae TaxID=1443141 RepID=A0ABQ3DXH4_9GAMM|nr:glucan biosynthesis protein D [Salinicola rhizosphaerae]GHB18256.1 glucans biosynthesis protein D [Salinicola rhizosphaerae]
MDRRSVLKSAIALAAWYGLPSAPLFAAAKATSGIADGDAESFSFEWLQGFAKDLAAKAYQSNVEKLPPTLANLTPQQYNAIGYDPEHSLWHDKSDQLDVQFFHVGMAFNQPVRMYSIDADTQKAREIHFRPDLFDYSRADVDVSQLEGQGDLGFAGFRVFKAPLLTEKDIVSFLGASYFRAVDDTYQYGLSARGVAVNTYADGKTEEFPAFTRFWFETPEEGSTTFTAYALLDSPSLSGAYRFIIHCEEQRVVMEIDKHLYPREAITQLGVTPMTSMFSCGTQQRDMCLTYHPQIHDSDRLSMWLGNGEWVCRPLNNPPRVQFNTFSNNSPKGFGLLQTDHDFTHYEDIVGHYHERPSLWVEPKGDWGKGEMQMLEIPTTGETMDNVVAFWKPEKAVEPGQTLSYGYKLYWSAQPPVKPDMARVRKTFTGIGGFPEGWAPGEHYPDVWAKRIAVDFIGGQLKHFYDSGIDIKTALDVPEGDVKQLDILWVDEIEGFRIQFDWYPTSDSTDPINMRLHLVANDDTVSETWLYQYFPPAPEERTYPEHPAA